MPSINRHPLFSRLYPPLARLMDRRGARHHRKDLLADLSGEILEVGAGNGLNFAHYPTGVTRVVAVEPEPHLRALAVDNARDAAVPIEVVDGTAGRLPVADASVDAAVTSLVLCSVPDQAAALREVRRVLRPGGELRFLEHVAADTTVLRRVQQLLDATVWPLVGGGCHLGRDTATAIEDADFAIERLDTFRFPESPPTPSGPHVLGLARPSNDTPQ